MTLETLIALEKQKVAFALIAIEDSIKQYKEGLVTPDEMANTLVWQGSQIHAACTRVGGMSIA